MKHIKVWRQLVSCSFGSFASNRIDSFSYLTGKLMRFGFFWLFITSVFRFTPSFVGYTKQEVLLFFLTFNFVDVLAQIFFRGIYLFTSDVRKGNFDFVLAKPVNPLFFILSRLIDILDFVFLFPIMGCLVYVVMQLPYALSAGSFFWYFAYIVLGLVIILGIHIFTASIAIWTEESEHVIWLYREGMTIGRFPPDMLPGSLQFLFTYVIPIIVVVSYPTKALLGELGYIHGMIAVLIACGFLGVSLVFWKKALRAYSSASS